MKTYLITINGSVYEVTVGDVSFSPVTVTVNGQEFQVDLPESERVIPGSGAGSVPATPRPAVPPSGPRPSVPSPAANDGSVRALMPGRIISVNVNVGEEVTVGQALLVMESMKMENTVSASHAGKVTAILVAEGDSVQHGQTMIEIDIN